MPNGDKTDEALSIINIQFAWYASKEPLMNNTSQYAILYKQNNIICGHTYTWLVSGSNFRGSSCVFLPVVTLGSGLKLEATGTGTVGSKTNPWIISKVN